MDDFSYIANAHPDYIEGQYDAFRNDADAVDEEWRKFFEGFDYAIKYASDGTYGKFSPKEFKVWNLINAYRSKGHLISKTNPIRERKDRNAGLELESLGFSEKDLDEEFHAGELLGLGKTSLRRIIEHLHNIYCRSLGFEYMYVTDDEIRDWLQEKIEKSAADINLPIEKKKRILRKLNETVVFEKFLNTKYIGQKRFSLEGGENTIPALDAIINTAAASGTDEVIIGMAHRGRLNVLANVLGKTYEHIFSEFEDSISLDLTMGDGDVKYHVGFSSEVKTDRDKKVKLKIAPNPSHLEAVSPVVQGYARAKADTQYEDDFKKILPVHIHGDAALTGQGVVYEVLQMSRLKGYQTGGTVHFVINNQIGFTTDFDDARSSHYSTSLGSVVHAPVIHVNGDDAEAVVFAVELATAFRQKFQRDVFVDMVCFRKHGHNEGDDPKFTQPDLYRRIAKHPNAREIYTKKLIQGGAIEGKVAKQLDKEFWDDLQERLKTVRENGHNQDMPEPEPAWKKFRRAKAEDFDASPKTAINQQTIDTVVDGLIKIPDGFKPLRKIEKMLQQRREMFFDKHKLDWASAELLAYGSLLLDGYHVRLSGQDAVRGTFSHRHAILYDEETNEGYNRLSHLSKKQGQFRIYNSPLSEYGVLGFEYGYSIVTPDTLTIWEAQFGDFSNGAQVVIDQFISSAESKWQQMSGLVLFLPHGYSGQGPEHSSARLERFLQLSAEFNMIVAYCTDPANYFHLLRRQLTWNFRKPLIHMAPKSLLRHPRVVSPVSDVKKGGFREVIDDPVASKRPDKVKRVLLCSGKVFFDLIEQQEKDKRNDVAIVRLEQLHPLPYKQLDAVVDKYKNAEFFWVQEEPANMGAWTYMLSCYPRVQLHLVARKSSASPATGYKKMHEAEQATIVKKSFDLKSEGTEAMGRTPKTAKTRTKLLRTK